MNHSTSPKASQYADFYVQDFGDRIEEIAHLGDVLEVKFQVCAQVHQFDWFWLQDHCIDSESLNQQTLQRTFDTFTKNDKAPSNVRLDEDKQLIYFTWPDGNTTITSAFLLYSVIKMKHSVGALAPKLQRFFWDRTAPLTNLPSVSHNALMQDDESLLTLLENIYQCGFSLIHETPQNEQDINLMAERIATIQETIFGKMWLLHAEIKDHGDTAYSTSFLEPHTDATYYNDAAGLQMFNCFEFDGQGGESIQVDGFALAQQLKQNDPKAYDVLSKVIVPGHYVEPGIHLHAQRPVLQHDRFGNLQQVSFNNYDRAPFLLPYDEMNTFYHAYTKFHQLVNDKDNWLKIKLEPGVALIFDNWRNLHGRMRYSGKRTFYGCYHTRSSFESQLRVLTQRCRGDK